MYSGAIVLDKGSESMVVPVEVAVASPEQDGSGTITGRPELGGEDVAEAQADYLYNNGSVFGANEGLARRVGRLALLLRGRGR